MRTDFRSSGSGHFYLIRLIRLIRYLLFSCYFLDFLIKYDSIVVQQVNKNDQDENKENTEYKFDPNNWWLNKDENRNDTVDEISIDEQV